MRDGVLYRMVRNVVTKRKAYLYVVPFSLRSKVLKGVHDAAGHQGQQRTVFLARQRFHWLGLSKDVAEYVRCCRQCVVSKSPEPEARAPLENIRTSEPLDLVCVDFWSAEDSANRSLDVLVVTDHFTKMAQAFLCPNQSAKSVAHQLWHNYFCIYGFPKRLHSDQGANFESALIAELLTVAGVQKSHTTPYHPMGNGSCERMNRTLGNMIRTLPPRAKQRWPQALKSLTFAYNCTIHETTGYAPFLLMFGRVPRLPIDIIFSSVLDNPEVMDYDHYVQSLRKDQKEAMTIAQAAATKQLQRHTELYNRKVRGAPVDVGDRVLLANKGERGKRKLADRWENTIYFVVGKNGESNTFKIQHASTGQEKVVHRNLIMPVNFLPLNDSSQDEMDVSFLSSSVELTPGKEGVADASVHSAEYRTRAWVSTLPSGAASEMALEIANQSRDAVIGQERDEVSHICVSTGSSETSVRGSPCNPAQSVADKPLDPLLCTENQSIVDGARHDVGNASVAGDVDSRLRSRAGRLLKPVTRLIEMMHHKTTTML